ncbi:MAG: hypothetical protein U5K54_12170 [Cytophagales bacterium]|nr:hypothetical protein [Cytophagales bacterium]
MTSAYFKRIVQSEVQEYLVDHEDSDEKDLVLQHKELLGVPMALLAQQILGRRKAKSKLATWYKTKGMVYPPSVNIEQCSSEATARFKTRIAQSILSDLQNATIADLTGGFGVDSYFFSLVFVSVHYVEPDADLFQIASANHQTLKAKSIVHHQTTAEDFIATRTKVDLVYIDPSRRDSNSRKVFRLADCTPDISSLQHNVFEHSPFLLVKASPLLDIQQGLRELTHTKKYLLFPLTTNAKSCFFYARKTTRAKYKLRPLIFLLMVTLKTSYLFPQRKRKIPPAFWEKPLNIYTSPTLRS